MEKIQRKIKGRIEDGTIDTIGAGLSFACAVHCLLMPFIIGILPLIGLSFLADHLVELLFVVFSVSLALFSLCWGYRAHRNQSVFILLMVSLLFLGSGLFISSDNFHFGFLVAGALGLMTAHLLNRKLCRSCFSCGSSER